MTDRFPYPVRRARERAARRIDRLLLILAVIVIGAMFGGLL